MTHAALADILVEHPMSQPIPNSAYESILSVAHRLSSTSDLAEVLAMIIDALRDLLSAERASVFQYDEDADEFFATKAHGLPSDLRIKGDAGFIGAAGQSRQVINTHDAYADPRFNQAVDKSTGFRTRCILTIPLMDHEQRLVGVAQVLNKRTGPSFDTNDESIAVHLARQAAVALRRAQLLEAERTKRKLQADLELARSIQFAALPDDLPEVAGYTIAATTRPADETGGDTFDVIPLGRDARRVLFMMADATGHGVGPALSVTQVVSMIRMAARMGADHDQMSPLINSQLCEDLPPGRFVTAFIGILDADRNELRYMSAGQAPMLVYRASGQVEKINDCSAPPLGIDPEVEFESTPPVRFEPGDGFVLLSDGYFEAMNHQRKQFGDERVSHLLLENPNASADGWLERLQDAVRTFAEGAPQLDDQTAVVIRRQK